jgi:hypothetical protein
MIDLAIPRMVENEWVTTTNGYIYRRAVGPYQTLTDDPTLETHKQDSGENPQQGVST